MRIVFWGIFVPRALIQIIFMFDNDDHNTGDHFGHCDDATHIPWAVGIVGKKHFTSELSFQTSDILRSSTGCGFLCLITFWLSPILTQTSHVSAFSQLWAWVLILGNRLS